jgi:hypothetical protein
MLTLKIVLAKASTIDKSATATTSSISVKAFFIFKTVKT